MGCLNSTGSFSHWFGNIHLSGPCNRACYFCIGQHMMALDSLNNLDIFPLKSLDAFINECNMHGIREINITGSNTDPLLYKHLLKLKLYLLSKIPDLVFGIRTNAVLALSKPEDMLLFDKVSISITSFNPDLYQKTMGMGVPPDIESIIVLLGNRPTKLNVVMCPETVKSNDIFNTLDKAASLGIKKVNFREPYGQPHIGNPLVELGEPSKLVYGMPCYNYKGIEATVWDVHWVEVESVNLYANGEVSITYPVTKGHDPIDGKVEGQENFRFSGRVRKQWVQYEKR